MIRRLLWLTLGAALGVATYRRLAALARSLPPMLRLSELTGFAADVREGMALYEERHPRAKRAAGRFRGELAGTARHRTNDVKDGH